MNQPPRAVLAAQVGLGKTQAFIRRLPELIDLLSSGHCVLVTVPDHGLSFELRDRLTVEGIDAAVYLGPSQADPEQSDEMMCRRPDDLRVFQKAGVAAKLCKVCPQRRCCGYLRQRQRKASVWIAAHQVLYRKRRPPIPPVDFLFVDENPLPAGLEGNDPAHPLRLVASEVPEDVAWAIRGLPRGVPLRRDDLCVSDHQLRELARRAFRQRHKIELAEAASEAEIAAARDIAVRNADCVKQAEFYREMLRQGLSGMRAVQLEDGDVGLDWLRHRRLHRDFDVPVLIADATAQEEMIRRLFEGEHPPLGWRAEPNIDEDGSVYYVDEYPLAPVVSPVRQVQAETPHVSYRQVLFSGAASKFGDSPSGKRNAAKVRRYVEARSVAYCRVLVICQKALEARLRAAGLPDHVDTAHFNALRGQDKWGDVDLMIIVGRSQPPPLAAERRAEALFREEVKSLGSEYYDRPWAPLMGSGRWVKSERHPCTLAELVRWSVCEAELVQAIGRGRGVNRDAASPLQVDLINQVPLPDIEIDEVVTWKEAQPAAGDVIAGRYGLLLPGNMMNGQAKVVAALLPDMFAGPNAARQARMYSRAETPNKEYQLGVSAREYIHPARNDAATPVALKAPDCRYAVPALATRMLARRPLAEGEEPPDGADLNDEGVLVVGDVYVLKEMPRRLKAYLADIGNAAHGQ